MPLPFIIFSFQSPSLESALKLESHASQAHLPNQLTTFF